MRPACPQHWAARASSSSGTTSPAWRSAATRCASSNSCWPTRSPKVRTLSSLPVRLTPTTAAARPRRPPASVCAVSSCSPRGTGRRPCKVIFSSTACSAPRYTSIPPLYPPRVRRAGMARLWDFAAGVRARGGRPYLFPAGGSTALGVLGYTLMVEELLGQLAARHLAADYLVVASGTGGTHAGLLLGT